MKPGKVKDDGRVLVGARIANGDPYVEIIHQDHACYFVPAYEARALAYLPDGPCQFPELVQRLLDAGEKVVGFRSDDTWYDLGTISEYERAVAELERRGGSLA